MRLNELGRLVRKRPSGRLLFLGLVVVLVGTVAAGGLYELHLERVTGRRDLPRVSCLYCHRSPREPVRARDDDGPRYVDPVALAVSPDGRRLYVASRGSDRLLEVDLERGTVSRSVGVGAGPQDLDLGADGRIAVTCRDGDEVVLVDEPSMSVQRRIATCAEPTGVVLDARRERLFVAEAASGEVAQVPLTRPGSDGPVARLVAGAEPHALALSDDGSLLVVASRRVQPAPQHEVAGAEVTLIDARLGRVRERRQLISAHLSEDVALTADGAWALVPTVHFRNHLPITQVARGAVMNSALTLVETAPGGRTVQVPLDELNACFADPGGVAITPDGRLAFVAHQGARVVSVVDLEGLRRRVSGAREAELESFADDLSLSGEYVLGRIPTRDAPGALAMAPDGSRLFVAERLADSVAVIDVAALAVVDRIDLGGPRELTPERLGERVFHDASVTFQGQFSCASCHPDGNTDGLIWDFEIDGIGQNLLETRSLRGIRDTSPFKWNGKNPDLETQCGPRFARVLTRSDPFEPGALEHLVAYIESIPPRSRRAPPELAPAVERGRRIFFRTHTAAGRPIAVADRCSTCHRPPLYTDRFKAEVGTGGAFDTPHLLDLSATAPYLHDGRAQTLEEIWTVHSPTDTHGITSDLSKVELNDLIVFLRSL